MNPFIGPLYAIKGFNLIIRPGLRRYVLIPLLVNIILFSGAIWLSTHYFDAYMTQVLPQGYDWIEWLLWPLFAITMLLIMFFSFTLVANFICAPFNGLLAEAVERELTGSVAGNNTSLLQALKETPESVWNEVRKLGYFLLRAIPLLILFVIPGLNLLAPFIWLAFSAWLLAKEYLDYPMANHGIGFDEQRRLIKQERLGSLGFGASITFLTMIPVVNFIVMPLGVAGATAMYLDKLVQR
jgi:CysZ protein